MHPPCMLATDRVVGKLLVGSSAQVLHAAADLGDDDGRVERPWHRVDENFLKCKGAGKGRTAVERRLATMHVLRLAAPQSQLDGHGNASV